MNNFIFRIIVYVACIVVLVSCSGFPVQITPTPPPSPTTHLSPVPTKLHYYYDWKRSWLNSPVCAPPCWEGIVPGRTSLQEAINIIKNMAGVENLITFKDGIEWDGAKSYRGVAQVEENSLIIADIAMNFGRDANINIHEAIDVFGEPSYIQMVSCAMDCFVNIIYPEAGLALRFELRFTADSMIMIDESTEVVGVVFFEPGLDNFIKISSFQGFAVKKWMGYGAYKD